MNKNEFVWLGGNVYVPYSDITLLTVYGDSQTKKLVNKAKAEDKFIDYSHGRGKETVALLKSGIIIATDVEIVSVLNTFRGGNDNEVCCSL